MSSINEELPPPPPPPAKTRASPLDFRNTDLVSRLLAATPPYLYNMPIVPNSYFFSEMLRSFVQAKAERSQLQQAPQSHRRSRKRSWTQVRSEYYQREAAEKAAVADITPPSNQHWKPPENKLYYDNKPLELTTERPGKIEECYQKLHENKVPMLFPPPAQEQNQNLILPPPPPIWYPPLYPAPYGIDPLHFFIDLRVSGHIYDRKNNKDEPAPTPPQPTQEPVTIKEGFKQSRHASAFSVPSQLQKSSPINLSNAKSEENKPTKFDVKSMGFEKPSNKTSTHYILKNVDGIYRDLNHKNQYKTEPDETKEETEEERQKRVKDLRALIGLELVVDYMNKPVPMHAHHLHQQQQQQLQQQQQQQQQSDESSTTDNESSGSPPLEVVSVHDDEQTI